MKVAVLNQPWNRVVPPVDIASLAIWSYHVGRRLTQSCEVVIYARQGPGDSSAETHEGVEYRRFPVPGKRHIARCLNPFWPPPGRKRPFFASSLFHPVYVRRAARDMARRGCDVVHIFNFSQFVPVVRKLNPRARIVLHMECEWLTMLDCALLRRRLMQADAIAGCSRYISDGVQRRFPELADRCCTLYNGVDERVFCPDHQQVERSDSPSLLFVSRISPEKGVHVLLKAMPHVVERYPEIRLDIVGPAWEQPAEYLVQLTDDTELARLKAFYGGAGYRACLDRLMRELGLENHVRWHGLVPHSQIVEHYRRASMLVSPSLNEPFGMSLPEAMAVEKPVVATQVGGIQDIVEVGETGILVPPGSPKALAAAILHLLAEPAVARRMGEAGRRRVQALFSWDRIAESALEVYRGAPSLTTLGTREASGRPSRRPSRRRLSRHAI